MAIKKLNNDIFSTTKGDKVYLLVLLFQSLLFNFQKNLELNLEVAGAALYQGIGRAVLTFWLA